VAVGQNQRLRHAAEAPAAKTIQEVVERLWALEASLPPTDGVACFTHLYLAVTLDVKTAAAKERFRNERFLERLNVVFANLFFDALRLSVTHPAAVPRAWAALFEARSRPHVARIQFALAGMSAHINRDLPVAVVRTATELKIDLEHCPAEYSDYQTVNRLLAVTERKVKRELLTGVVEEVDDVLGKIDDRIAMWDLAKARETAWCQAETLWTLRKLPPASAAFLDALDRTVGFAGRGLLVPIC
jgi:Family of unknown function (DUF5995)